MCRRIRGRISDNRVKGREKGKCARVMNHDVRRVGFISQRTVDLLGLKLAGGTPILMGKSNVEHIKNRHPYEFDKYYNDIENILEKPDYVGKNPNDDSILFVKEYKVNSEYIRVAVKVTASKKCYAKTLHLLSTCNVERYIARGTLIKFDKNE